MFSRNISALPIPKKIIKTLKGPTLGDCVGNLEETNEENKSIDCYLSEIMREEGCINLSL